jgi:urease accessory protein
MKRAGLAAALVLLLCPGVALAHGTLQMGEFYTGLSQPIFHPETLLVVLALLLWGVQRGEPLLYRVPLAFAGAVVAGSILAELGIDLPQTAWVGRAGAFALGLLAAARRGLPGPAAVAVGLALVLGLAVGHAATWPERDALGRPWLFALGLGAAVLIAWGYAASFALRFRQLWAEVALRIAGSWIATVTLLVSALSLARR